MRDYENPVHVPPMALKILSLGLIAAFIVAPLVAALRSGNPGNLLVLIGAGLALVGLVIGMMFIYRLVLWFIFAFYWYIAAISGIVLFLLSLIYISDVLPMPTLPDTTNVSPLINVLILGGVVFGIVALYLVFRSGGAKQSTKAQPPPSVATPPPAPSKQKRILDTAQQIASRRRDLGLDKDD